MYYAVLSTVPWLQINLYLMVFNLWLPCCLVTFQNGKVACVTESGNFSSGPDSPLTCCVVLDRPF